MPTIEANGCNFYYELQGQGPDIVFIHGEIHGSEYWEYQFPELSRGYRCLAYNRRGHYGTELTNFGYSLVNQTRDLGALIDKLEIKQPVIIAVAFGTAIAANYAIQNPDRVKGMMLVAWSELHDAFQYFHRWKAYNDESTKVLETKGRDAFVELLRADAGKRIYKVIPVNSAVREKAIQMFARHPIELYRQGMLELGSSVPDLISDFSPARPAGAWPVRRRRPLSRRAGTARGNEELPRGARDSGRRPLCALGAAERVQRGGAGISPVPVVGPMGDEPWKTYSSATVPRSPAPRASSPSAGAICATGCG